MKTNPIQTSFNSGETSPELDGRVDLEKYASSCSRMENFYPLVQGPARRRPGTKFINRTKSALKTWLQRFVFNRENAYIMEINSSCTRFHTASGTVLDDAKTITGATQANPCVITIAGHGYSSGHWVYIESVGGMTQLNNKYYKITVLTANTFSLQDSITESNVDSSAYAAYTVGGTAEKVAEISQLYATDFEDGSCSLNFAQNGDILYCADKNGETQVSKITRTAANAFSWSALDPDTGPFEDVDPDNTITVYSDVRTGACTLTASSAIFTASDIGAPFYLEQKSVDDIEMWEPAKAVAINDIRRSDGKNYRAVNAATTGTVRPTHTSGTKYDGDGGVQWEFRDPGYGVVRISAIGGGGTTATGTVVKPIPDGAVLVGQASTRWAHADWWVNGHPTHVTFFRDRLVLARSSDQKIWFSVSADYENFSDRDDGGIVTSDMAATIQLTSEQPNEIKWIMPGDKLIVGTTGPEFAVSEITTQDVFGPGNIKATPQTSFGSTSVSPSRIGNTLFFVQSSGRKVRELAYSLEADGLASVDITRLSPRMVPKSARITQLAYQQEPNSIIWAAKDDGGLVGFTYNREENVFGWHRHVLGGSGIVESVECIPEAGGGRDETWMCVKRTIDGVTQRYIELLNDDWDSTEDIEDAWYVDCGLKYDSTPATTISGLEHLEGETVSILADGAAHPDRTVTDGAVTLQNSASVVIAGLKQTAKLATKRIESGAQSGTAQTRVKKLSKVWVRFLDTVGGKMGPNEDTLQTIVFRSASAPMSAAVEAFTGDKEVNWRGGYERDGIMWYVNDQPLPCTIVALVPEMETNE